MTTFTDEQVVAAIDSAPELVQTVLRSANTAKIIAATGNAHRLHIDQIGTLATLNRNLLIGLISPEDMYTSLVEIGIPSGDAQAILKEINEQIFQPLRAEMEKQGVTISAPTQPPPPPPAAAPTFAPVPTAPAAAAPQTAPTTPDQQVMISATQAPQTPSYYQPQTAWPGHPGANWQPAAAVHVYVPTGGFVPHPGGVPVHQAAPTPPQPSLERVVEAVERQAAAQPVYQAPAAMPAPQTTPEVAARPLPPPPPNLPGATPPQTPIEKSYGNDPYREPV